MNDRKPVELDSERPHISPLIREYCNGLRELQTKVKKNLLTAGEAVHEGKDLFQILLERNSLPIDQSNEPFWDELRARLLAYFIIPKDHYAWLSKVAEDANIDEWAADQLAKYRRELQAPDPVTGNKSGFSARFLRFF